MLTGPIKYNVICCHFPLAFPIGHIIICSINLKMSSSALGSIFELLYSIWDFIQPRRFPFPLRKTLHDLLTNVGLWWFKCFDTIAVHFLCYRSSSQLPHLHIFHTQCGNHYPTKMWMDIPENLLRIDKYILILFPCCPCENSVSQLVYPFYMRRHATSHRLLLIEVLLLDIIYETILSTIKVIKHHDTPERSHGITSDSELPYKPWSSLSTEYSVSGPQGSLHKTSDFVTRDCFYPVLSLIFLTIATIFPPTSAKQL